MLKALDSPDDSVLYSAALALGEIGDEQAVAGLLRALDDPFHRVSGNAAGALAKIGSKQAVAGLLKALDNPYHNARSSVAEALGEIGDEQAVAGLLKVLDNLDDDVFYHAVSTLEKNDSGREIAALWQARMKHPTESELGKVIAAIQSRCKYYNHELLQE